MQICSAGESHTVTNSLTAGGIYQITADTQAITSRELTTALENLKTASASVTEENVLSDNYLGALLDCMGKTYFAQVDIADRLLAEQLSVPTSRSLSVGMTGYVPATGQLFLDIDHDVHMVSANGEKERQFLLLSGMISSAYESIVLEQFTGIPSVSTMSLLAQAAEQDIGIEILTAADYEEKKAGLALPDSTLAAMEQEIAAGKIVIVPREEQCLMEWQGSGYIVLDRETLAGSYMIEGGLNGGNCGIEVGLMYLTNLILTAADVYDLVSLMAGVLQLFSSMALLTPGAVVLGMLGLMAITLVISAMMIAVIDSYLEVGYLIDMYVDGNEAAGEAAKDILVINGIWAVGSWGASGMVRYCSNRAAAGWLKETMGYSSAPRLINALGGDAKTATKVCQSLKRAGFGSEAIADMAERLGRDGTLKLERLASGGLSGDILEALAKNEDLLGRYSADTLLSFKGSACAADTVMDFLRQADVDGASLYRIYGDKVVDIWKTMGKKGLESLWDYGDEFLEQYQRRGSEFVQDFLKNGDAALRGGTSPDLKIQQYIENIIDASGNVDTVKMNDLRLAIQKGTFSKEEISLLSRKMSDLGITETYEEMMKNIHFGTYLRNIAGEPPADMLNPHAHHILFKTGNGPAQQALVEEGQSILRKYGIDPVVGPENLVWAPNGIVGQHDIVALTEVVDALRAVDEMGGDYDDIVNALKELGDIASQRK